MQDWTAGYVSEIAYTYGYYPELNPQRARLALLSAGLLPPEFRHACELGFGQGVSVNIHAAAAGAVWHGTDFNPTQTAFAQDMARASGVAAHLRDQAFAEFCADPTLPEFDFIGLHGVWSWVSDANREVLVDFLRRKLAVGGVLCISYNTMPGWASFAPMRHLMAQHMGVLGSDGQGITARIDGALDFVGRLFATQPLFARANPLVAERVEAMKGYNRHYLAHEFFNRDWHPMHVATVADWLAPAKLSYACSANLTEHVPALGLTPEQRSLLAEIPDRMFRETVRDFMLNTQFRRDYWVKGRREASPLQLVERLRAERVVLAVPRQEVSLTLPGPLGEVTLNPAVYGPVLDALADHAPRAIGELPLPAQGGFGQLLEAVLLLCGSGQVAPAQEEAAIQAARPVVARLNAHLCAAARGSADVGWLASPVTGGGVPVDRVAQMFLGARAAGIARPAAWAEAACATLASQGQGLLREGKPIASEAENLAEMTRLAEGFATHRLPLLQALGVA